MRCGNGPFCGARFQWRGYGVNERDRGSGSDFLRRITVHNTSKYMVLDPELPLLYITIYTLLDQKLLVAHKNICYLRDSHGNSRKKLIAMPRLQPYDYL